MSSENEKRDLEKQAADDPIAEAVIDHIENAPTEEESATLRRVPGGLPLIAYTICAVEFAERASYYGVSFLIPNFINRPFPEDGNGMGAPKPGTQDTAGALNWGLSKANAIQQSFNMLVYITPIFFGWISDKYTGRFKMICIGIGVVGGAHALMCGAGAPHLLQTDQAAAPYIISVYILALGSAMFKPNISPLLLDQVRTRDPEVKTLDSGERVIVDPEATAERVMLWFYLMINVGAFMSVATSYTEKLHSWWLSFLLPLILYIPLPFLLWFLHKRLILYPPGGSDLGRVFKILGICLRRGVIGKKGFWDHAKPSVIAQSGKPIDVEWNDEFVNDVRTTFQATGIFCFFPIQYINDNGLGSAASGLSTMLVTDGVPNDVIQNFNTLSIILVAPILNYGLYPFLRRKHIKFGPIKRITLGIFMSACGGVGYTVLNHYAYKLGPCGSYGSSDCEIGEGVAPISIWWMGIPFAIGGISELFINVPAYAIAYSRAPKNMRGLVSALNLFNTGIAYAIGLACTAVVTDPYLTWDFGVPSILGFVLAAVFYFTFRHIDKEEVKFSKEDEYESAMQAKAADEHLPPTDRQPSVVASLDEKH